MMGSTQVTGNGGLYYCSYKLSMLGWNVMPTARNARGLDIIAYRGDGTGFAGIQVKTLSRRAPVSLGLTLDNTMGDYWVIVNEAVSASPRTFILLPSEVTAKAHRGERDGKVSYWLQPKDYELDEYREAWGRLGQPID